MNIANVLTHIATLFSPDTMSVHIKAGQFVRAKKGRPGAWILESLTQQWSKKELTELKNTMLQLIQTEQDHHESINAFVEIHRTYSYVLQLGPYRIVYTEPPVSEQTEFTIVRPVKKMSLEDYALEPILLQEIANPHHGILIAWSPGEGKSTFAQALTDHLTQQNLIIKTIEAPRDLQVDPTITQLSFFHASHQEIRDILLLTRPDVTIFDEVRNQEDFHLYKDLRLAGIGMIGVMHATEPIDALQRFLHAVDLGSTAHVISTIVFIKAGSVQQMLKLHQTVKVPTGMQAEDLARPVIEVTDVKTGAMTHEVYSYGEQVVVMPLEKLTTKKQSIVYQHAQQSLQHSLTHARWVPLQVQVNSPQSITVYVPEEFKGEVIWKQGEHIKRRENKLGCSISIKTKEPDQREEVDPTPPIDKKKRSKKWWRRRR